jgi:hypothetical protein
MNTHENIQDTDPARGIAIPLSCLAFPVLVGQEMSMPYSDPQ